jgi:ribulose-phosphate 3-epimerase
MSQVAICPTITAFNAHQYRAQMERLEPFAGRVHIDLMDGLFAPHISPGIDQVWWPDGMTADIHLMYEHPAEYAGQLIKLKPNLVVIHYEADLDPAAFAGEMKNTGIKAGLAIMQKTAADEVMQLIDSFDHVMVYSGNLGEHGGTADLRLLDKVRKIRAQFPDIEISWDGGINDQNAKELVEAGVNVLNVGGFIQNSDNPELAYNKVASLIA